MNAPNPNVRPSPTRVELDAIDATTAPLPTANAAQPTRRSAEPVTENHLTPIPCICSGFMRALLCETSLTAEAATAPAKACDMLSPLTHHHRTCGGVGLLLRGLRVAVDGDGLPGDRFGAVGGQEQRQRGDVVGAGCGR